MSLYFPKVALTQFESLTEHLWEVSLVERLLPRPRAPIVRIVVPENVFASVFLELFSTTPLAMEGPINFHLSGNAKVFGFPLEWTPIVRSSFFVGSSTIPVTADYPPYSPTPKPVSAVRSTTHVMSSSYSAAVELFPESHDFVERPEDLSLSL